MTNNGIEQQKREDIIDDSSDNRINSIVTDKEISAIESILQSNMSISNDPDDSKRKQKSTLTPKRFTNSVELLVDGLDLSYSDSIILCADYYAIEISAISKFLVPQIVEKLKIEAIGNRMLSQDSNVDPLVFA